VRSSGLRPAVLLGGSANTISVARSLASRGVEVIAYGNQHGHVRYSRAVAAYNHVGRGPRIGERWLRTLVQRRHGGVLLPCDDDALELIASHRAELVEAGYLPFEADDGVVLAMLDKARTYELARAAGISTPRVVRLTDEESVDRALEEVGLPSALKPVHSHAFTRVYGGRKAFRVSTPAELRRLARETREAGLEMLAIEIIPGADDRLCSYYAYIDEDGRTLVGLTKRKIRQYPSGFGLGSYEVTDSAPDVAAAGAAFFAAVGVRGLANVEFKRDRRDEQLRLIECNHRFTASNQLIEAAGVDLAWLAYARLTGQPLPPLDRYRTGITLWNPVRDLRGLVGRTVRGEARVGDWLPGLLRHHVLPVFRWDDPLPTLAYHASRIAAVPEKLGVASPANHATARL
jgi:D-aspartate ligase